MPSSLVRMLAAGAVAGAMVLHASAEESPEKLAQQLTAQDVALRRDAAYQLNRLGPAAKPVLPALIKALEDDDKQVWSSAVNAIAAFGPEAKDAIPTLILGMDFRGQRGRRARDARQVIMRNSYALSRIGPAAVAPLLETLKTDDAGLRAGAARALGPLGAAARDAIPLLITNLGDGRDPVRDETITALGLIGPEAGTALVAALSDADVRRRTGAALALAQVSPAFKPAIDLVEKALATEKDATARAALITAWPKLGAGVDRTLNTLIPEVLSEDDAVRHAALNALLAERPLRAAAVPKLGAVLKDSNPATREKAARALGRFGADAAPALPALIEATRISGGAPAFADALAQIGAPVLPVLLKTLETGKPDDSAWVLRALRGFGAPAVPILNEALKSDKPAVRAAAATALGAMGHDAADAVNPLFVLAEDSHHEVQAAALRALVALRGDFGRLKPLLQAGLTSKDADVRKAAAAGLAAQGGAAQLGVPALVDLLADDDAAGRVAAVQALGQLGEQAAPAMEALAAKLTDPALQILIIETLGKIGPAAGPAVPKLAELAKSTDQRASVLPALIKIGPGAAPALPLIYTCLNDPAGDVRAAAASAVAAVEKDESKVLATLLPLASDPSARMRKTVAIALASRGAAAKPAVPAFVKMLSVETERADAMRALKGIGVDSVPDLKKMLLVKDARVRTFACERLGALGPTAKEAAPQLHELLQQDSSLAGPINAALKKIEVPETTTPAQPVQPAPAK